MYPLVNTNNAGGLPLNSQEKGIHRRPADPNRTTGRMFTNKEGFAEPWVAENLFESSPFKGLFEMTALVPANTESVKSLGNTKGSFGKM